jgi:hypothetical protein
MSFIRNWLTEKVALEDRTTRWLVGRALLGLMLIAKGVATAIHASAPGLYLLAGLLILGGLVFAAESADVLLKRMRQPKAKALDQ